jgi:hypothetical protein
MIRENIRYMGHVRNGLEFVLFFPWESEFKGGRVGGKWGIIYVRGFSSRKLKIATPHVQGHYFASLVVVATLTLPLFLLTLLLFFPSFYSVALV